MDEGVLAKIVIPEGTDHVAVNTPIAMIAEDGEDFRAATDEVSGTSPSSRKEPAQSRANLRSRVAARSAAQAPAGPANNGHPLSVPKNTAAKTVTNDVREASARRDCRGDAARSPMCCWLGEEVDADYQARTRSARAVAGIRGAPGHRYADYRTGVCRARYRPPRSAACGRSSSS